MRAQKSAVVSYKVEEGVSEDECESTTTPSLNDRGAHPSESRVKS